VIPSAVRQAQSWALGVLSDGDWAVDATVGNGQDTCFLARRVGPAGRVIGFDVQSEALVAASARLHREGLAGRVTLVHRGHEELAGWFRDHAAQRRPRVFMFNLGYRPGGDPKIVTRPDSTVSALETALELVVPGGLVTVVAYPGHEGGAEEAERVLSWSRSIPRSMARAVEFAELNTRGPAPLLIAVSRSKHRP
jgi:hypothetical protein